MAWSANIDRVLEHTPVRDADALKGIAAVALHDAAEWKQPAAEKAANSWAECDSPAEERRWIRPPPGKA